MSTAPASDAGAPVLDSDNPWPGLASYDEAAREFFSGRGAEAAELARRIADESVTVLFGKSGLGKSSLLRAGVFPLLRERGFLPVLVRLRYDADTAEPLEQIAAALFAAFAVGQIKHPPRRDGESLWEYLHREGLAFWAPKIRPARPVLVLDQFEEVFTLGRRAWTRVEAFREQFADLAENRIPAALAQRFEASGVASAGLDVHAQPYKIVLSLREDFLPDLEGWHAAMPSLRRNRMRLLPMGTSQALQAVWNERTRHLVDEPLAHEIVGFLASGAGTDDPHDDLGEDGDQATVEPALLSLVCRGINEARKRAGKEQFDAKLFDAGKGQIVADFYRESLADQRPQVRRFIEDELVTEQGFRNSFAVVAAVGSGAVTDDELAILVDRRLLRLEHHLGTERVELAHDLLTRAVLEGRVQRVAAERAAAQRKRTRLFAGAAAAVMAGVGALAWYQSDRARAAIDFVRSLELAAHATAAMPAKRDLAVLLALEALRVADTPEARSVLLEAARYAWPTAELSRVDTGGTPNHVAINADGSRVGVVAGGDPDTVSVWDVRARRPKQVWIRELSGQAITVAEFEPAGERLLVAQRGQIGLRDASTGDVQIKIQWPPTKGDDDDHHVVSQIAVSADSNGQWLAARTELGAIWVHDLNNPAAQWEMAQNEMPDEGQSMAFSLAPNGKRIAWATSIPYLHASIVERRPDGKWEPQPVDLTRCLKTQSLTPASEYVVATWNSQLCTRPLDKDTSKNFNQSSPIKDSIASANSGAFVAFLGDGSVRVGLDNPSKQRGVSLIKDLDVGSANLGEIAIDDFGTRLAKIGNSWDADGFAVSIVSVAAHKLLLSAFEPESLALLADGRRIAYVWPTPTGTDVELRVTAIDQVLRGDELPQPESHFSLAAMPGSLRGGKDRLIVTDPNGQMIVYDLRGHPVAGPIAGEAEFFGKDDELILVRKRTPAETIVVRADNGEQLEWDMKGARLVRLSEGGTALFVAQSSTAEPLTLVIEAFAVQGNRLLPAGRLVDVPAASIDELEISDDARSLTEVREGSANPLLWSLDPDRDTSARDPASAHVLESTELGSSNTGRFSVRSTLVGGSDHDRDGALHDIALYRDGTTIVHRFGTREIAAFHLSFSADDRWLAFTEGADLHVLDLRTRQPVLRWQGIDAEALEFDASGTLLRVELPVGEMLVPLLLDDLRRFAKWLVPRDLTEDERCKYGLGQCPVQSSR